jgi:hypothetical protein
VGTMGFGVRIRFFLMVALTLTNQTLDRFTRCRP